MAAIGETFVTIEHPDVIEPEKSALEDVVPFGVFAVHPPGKGQQHLVEDCFEKCPIAFAGLFALDLIDPPGCPGDYRGIDVTEVPFIRRDLSVRVLVPLPSDNIELSLREAGIDQGEGKAMKCQIPRCVPRIFPFVGHRHDTLVVKVSPGGVTTMDTFDWRRRLRRIAVEPLVDDVVIELLAPDHSGERLSLDRPVL